MLTPSFVGFPRSLQSGYQKILQRSSPFQHNVGMSGEWEELNTVLENNLVASGSTGGHIRTYGAIQWECELYRGRPKARCYPFDLDCHRFRGKNPQVDAWLYCMLINMLYNLLQQDCVCLIAPFPNNPNQPEDFDPKYDMDISGNGLIIP